LIWRCCRRLAVPRRRPILAAALGASRSPVSPSFTNHVKQNAINTSGRPAQPNNDSRTREAHRMWPSANLTPPLHMLCSKVRNGSGQNGGRPGTETAGLLGPTRPGVTLSEPDAGRRQRRPCPLTAGESEESNLGRAHRPATRNRQPAGERRARVRWGGA
jgi:hypothetical protein